VGAAGVAGERESPAALLGDPRHRLPGAVGVEIEDGDGRPGVGEGEGDGPADPRAAAGDEGGAGDEPESAARRVPARGHAGPGRSGTRAPSRTTPAGTSRRVAVSRSPTVSSSSTGPSA